MYCNSDDFYDTTFDENIGIRNCPEHASSAKQDCNAYLHLAKLVPMEDVHRIPILNTLIQCIHNKPVHIMSNGVLKPNWVIYSIDYPSKTTNFIYNINGIWYFPMLQYTTKTIERISLKSLLDIKENIYLPYSLIYKVLDTLTYGIYREDYDDLQKYKKDLQKSTKNNSDSLTGHISLNI
jgi:hypothetical protein